MVRGPDRTWRVGGFMELKKVGCFVNFIKGKYKKIIFVFFGFHGLFLGSVFEVWDVLGEAP